MREFKWYESQNVAKILIRASAISGSAREILQATSVNKIYVSMSNVMRLYDDCIIILQELNRRYIWK